MTFKKIHMTVFSSQIALCNHNRVPQAVRIYLLELPVTIGDYFPWLCSQGDPCYGKSKNLLLDKKIVCVTGIWLNPTKFTIGPVQIFDDDNTHMFASLCKSSMQSSLKSTDLTPDAF